MSYNDGLSGLKNLGNTCYMNTALQCLSHTKPLTTYFLSKKFISDYNNKNDTLVKEWYKLLNGLYEENCVVSPISFHRKMVVISSNNGINFGYSNQNDVQEFIIFFIDNLHVSLCKEVIITISGEIKNDLDRMALKAMNGWKSFFKNNYSKIIELFYGQLITTITVDEEIKSRTYSPICFFTLPIPKKKNITIYDCFDNFIKDELLVGDTQWHCDKTNNYYDAKKNTQFWDFPQILIVSFNRFDNFGNKKNDKINFCIENLDLSKYCVGYNKFKCQFELYAICNHIGTRNFGHYYAYCKVNNNKWYEFNDNIIKSIDIYNIDTSNAYCLFYQKKIQQ